MNKFDQVKKLGNDIMEGADDVLKSMCKTSFGSLELISLMDDETFKMIKKTLELMEISKQYVRVTSEAFAELYDMAETNQRLLRDIKELLSEKK